MLFSAALYTYCPYTIDCAADCCKLNHYLNRHLTHEKVGKKERNNLLHFYFNVSGMGKSMKPHFKNVKSRACKYHVVYHPL